MDDQRQLQIEGPTGLKLFVPIERTTTEIYLLSEDYFGYAVDLYFADGSPLHLWQKIQDFFPSPTDKLLAVPRGHPLPQKRVQTVRNTPGDGCPEQVSICPTEEPSRSHHPDAVCQRQDSVAAPVVTSSYNPRSQSQGGRAHSSHIGDQTIQMPAPPFRAATHMSHWTRHPQVSDNGASREYIDGWGMYPRALKSSMPGNHYLQHPAYPWGRGFDPYYNFPVPEFAQHSLADPYLHQHRSPHPLHPSFLTDNISHQYSGMHPLSNFSSLPHGASPYQLQQRNASTRANVHDAALSEHLMQGGHYSSFLQPPAQMECGMQGGNVPLPEASQAPVSRTEAAGKDGNPGGSKDEESEEMLSGGAPRSTGLGESEKQVSSKRKHIARLLAELGRLDALSSDPGQKRKKVAKDPSRIAKKRRRKLKSDGLSYPNAMVSEAGPSKTVDMAGDQMAAESEGLVVERTYGKVKRGEHSLGFLSGVDAEALINRIENVINDLESCEDETAVVPDGYAHGSAVKKRKSMRLAMQTSPAQGGSRELNGTPVGCEKGKTSREKPESDDERHKQQSPDVPEGLTGSISVNSTGDAPGISNQNAIIAVSSCTSLSEILEDTASRENGGLRSAETTVRAHPMQQMAISPEPKGIEVDKDGISSENGSTTSSSDGKAGPGSVSGRAKTSSGQVLSTDIPGSSVENVESSHSPSNEAGEAGRDCDKQVDCEALAGEQTEILVQQELAPAPRSPERSEGEIEATGGGKKNTEEVNKQVDVVGEPSIQGDGPVGDVADKVLHKLVNRIETGKEPPIEIPVDGVSLGNRLGDKHSQLVLGCLTNLGLDIATYFKEPAQIKTDDLRRGVQKLAAVWISQGILEGVEAPVPSWWPQDVEFSIGKLSGCVKVKNKGSLAKIYRNFLDKIDSYPDVQIVSECDVSSLSYISDEDPSLPSYYGQVVASTEIQNPDRLDLKSLLDLSGLRLNMLKPWNEIGAFYTKRNIVTKLFKAVVPGHLGFTKRSIFPPPGNVHGWWPDQVEERTVRAIGEMVDEDGRLFYEHFTDFFGIEFAYENGSWRAHEKKWTTEDLKEVDVKTRMIFRSGRIKPSDLLPGYCYKNLDLKKMCFMLCEELKTGPVHEAREKYFPRGQEYGSSIATYGRRDASSRLLPLYNAILAEAHIDFVWRGRWICVNHQYKAEQSKAKQFLKWLLPRRKLLVDDSDSSEGSSCDDE